MIDGFNPQMTLKNIYLVITDLHSHHINSGIKKTSTGVKGQAVVSTTDTAVQKDWNYVSSSSFTQ
jgi:hypothetical protein